MKAIITVQQWSRSAKSFVKISEREVIVEKVTPKRIYAEGNVYNRESGRQIVSKDHYRINQFSRNIRLIESEKEKESGNR